MIAQSRTGETRSRAIGAMMLAITMAIAVLVVVQDQPENGDSICE